MEVKTQDAAISQPIESEITQISSPSHHNQSGNGKAESTTSALPTDLLSKKYGRSSRSLEFIQDIQPSSSSNPQPQVQSKRSRSVRFAIDQLHHSLSTCNQTPKFSKSVSRKGSLRHHQPRNEKVESITSAVPTDSLSERHGGTSNSLENSHDNQPSSSDNPQPQLQSQGSRIVHLPIDQLFRMSSTRNQRPIGPISFDHQRSHKTSSNHHQLGNGKIESKTSILPIDALSEKNVWTPHSLENIHDSQPSSSNNPQPRGQLQESHIVHLPINQLYHTPLTSSQRSIDHLPIDSLSERHGWTPHSLENAHDSQPSSSNNPQPQQQLQESHIVHLPIDQLYRTASTSSQRSIDPKHFDHQRSCKDSPHHNQLGNGKAEFTTSILPTRSLSLSERFGWTSLSPENTHNSQSSSSHNPQPQQLQSQGSRIVHLPIGQLYHVPSTRNQIPLDSENLDRQRSHKTSSCCLSFSCILLIFIVLLVMLACILYLALMPKKPRFYIEKITFIFTQSHLQKLHPDYNISIQSENPNRHIGIHYLDSGSASLSYELQEIATGQPPAFYHGKKVTLYFNLILDSKDVLPKEIEDILKENNSRVEVPLLLSIHFPVKIKLWKLHIWKMKIKIICHVSIFVLAKEVDFETQHCKDTLLYTD